MAGLDWSDGVRGAPANLLWAAGGRRTVGLTVFSARLVGGEQYEEAPMDGALPPCGAQNFPPHEWRRRRRSKNKSPTERMGPAQLDVSPSSRHGHQTVNIVKRFRPISREHAAGHPAGEASARLT